MSKFLITIGLLFLYSVVQANDAVDTSGILAQRGNGVVTQADFAARAEKIPENIRRPTLRDRNRVRDVINTLLTRAQLVSDAREAGFDKDPLIAKRMELAAEAELADAWAHHYVDISPAADYEQLAYEFFILNKDEIQTSPKIDVSHILISRENRTYEEAKLLADSVTEKIKTDPGLFDELIVEYSEDPSAASNNGKFYAVKKGDMVAAFEKSAFSLKVGEISEPVKTEYGYHIIRLDGRIEPKQMSFEQVKQKLINSERKKHEDRVMRDYLHSLTSQEVKMTEEALLEMVKDQFGEDYLDPQEGGQEKE